MKKIALCLTLVLLLSACSGNSIANTTTPTSKQSTPAPSPAASVTSEIPAMATDTTGEGVILLKIIPEESTLSYEVGETFIDQNNRFATAIGMTSAINGEVFANPNDPSQSRLGVISVDISTLTSDNSRRDNNIRRNWLESNTYPLVTFVPRSITNLPEIYTPGQLYSFEVQGELTIKQTTLGATFLVTASYDGQELIGTAETQFNMSDYKIGPISIAGILNTEDLVKIKLDFVARP